AAAAAAAQAEAVPAGAPFAREAAVEGSSADALEAFLSYCEVELLVRRPGALSGIVGEAGRETGTSSLVVPPAERWFGGLVAAKPGIEGAAIRGLAAELHRGFMQSLDGEARIALGAEGLARLHVSDAGDDWVAPRLAALRETMEGTHGPESFRRVLRSLVDEHRVDRAGSAGAGAAIGWEELADAAEKEAPDLGARFVRAWLRSTKEPVVKARWSFDAARERVLLRVDQVHELRGAGVPPAYPFRLEVLLVNGEGAPATAVLDVDKRRGLFEVPAGFEPADVQLDPEGKLKELMLIRMEEAPTRGTGDGSNLAPSKDA
ncbi:MAG: hypothetical protein AAGG01_24625, partial [Planctomycetota bacterium]